jgi:uncharacterized protein (DUF697 family)
MTETAKQLPAPHGDLFEKASEIVRTRMYWSLGVGLVPIPLVDFAGLMAIQLEMVAKLAKLFDKPFQKELGKHVIASLVGSVVPTLAAGPLAGAIKLIPVIGYTTGAVTMCLVGAASTYALGKVFTKHFALGGTLFTFDADKMRDEFKKSFEEGKDLAAAGRE